MSGEVSAHWSKILLCLVPLTADILFLPPHPVLLAVLMTRNSANHLVALKGTQGTRLSTENDLKQADAHSRTVARGQTAIRHRRVKHIPSLSVLMLI